MKLHLKQLLDRFNVSHFVFYLCFLILTVLIGLRADLVIDWRYGVIFLPLWLWDIAIIGGLVGAIAGWCRSKELRQEDDHKHHFISLILSTVLQFFLIISELLVAVNLDTNSMPWSAVFAPMYIMAVASLPVCIWGCWKKRGIELELLVMVSLLQFVFLGLRLDGVTSWSWAVVFVPFWLVFIAFLIGEFIFMIIVILSNVLNDNQQQINDRRLPYSMLLVCAAVFTISLIIFMALLVSRLDGSISGPYSAILIPLHISVFCLLVSTFTRNPANPWWFGVKKTATECALDCCPLLQELANVSFTKVRQEEEEEEREEEGVWSKKTIATLPAAVVQVPLSQQTIENIYTPD